MFSDEISDKLATLQNVRTSSNDGKNIVTPLLAIFQDFLQSLTNKFDEFKDEMLAINRAKDEKIVELQNESKLKDQTISNLRNDLDSQDQYVRRETLIFSGDTVPAWKKDENCMEMICQLIPDKLGADIEVTTADISVAHRLGPKPKAPAEDRRSIIVRFCRRSVKYAILNRSRREKRKDLFVNESLTPTRLKIVRALKRAKNDHPDKISGYQTYDGSIYAWVKPANPNAQCSRVLLNTLDDLEKFCQRCFQESSSSYLPTRRGPTQDAA